MYVVPVPSAASSACISSQSLPSKQAHAVEAAQMCENLRSLELLLVLLLQQQISVSTHGESRVAYTQHTWRITAVRVTARTHSAQASCRHEGRAML
jgi:hypothetical protein